MRTIEQHTKAYRDSHQNTVDVLAATTEICGGLFAGVRNVTSAILAQKSKRRQPTIVESIRTGRRPDIG